MNRLERISSILVQLQSKPVITAQQIADHFDISLRTVYRDIKALEEAGIPLIGNVGVGYSLVEGYKLPPLMFTKEEAIAFLTAEKLIEKLTDTTNAQHYTSGMNKVRSVLRFVEKDYLSGIDNNIKILGHNSINTNLPVNVTQCILQSISEHRILDINYFTLQRQEESYRKVEPIGCFYSHHHWYLIAYCLKRNDYRSFRIDRIKNFKLTDQKYTKEHPTLSEYIKTHREQDTLNMVIIRIRKEDNHRFNDYKYYNGWEKEEVAEEYIDQYFKTFDLESFARWYLSFADIAEIIQPVELKEKVCNMLNIILSRIKEI